MKTRKPDSSSPATNKLHLRLVWGPTEALAARDVTRLAVVTASMSDRLVRWLRGDSSAQPDEARTDLLVRSFLCAMQATGWRPHTQHTSRPLNFGLHCQEEFVEVVTSVLAQGKHLLHFDLDDGSRN